MTEERRALQSRRPGCFFWFFLFVALQFSTSCSRNISAETKYTPERNKAALKSAISNIEKFRKGNASIRFGGRPRDSVVRIRQISHDFKFGCYIKLDDLDPADLAGYESAVSRIFNYAVLGTYWDFIEPVRGQRNWKWFDREVEFASRNGMRVGAAPVLWGTNGFGTPKWLPQLQTQLTPVVEERINDAISRSDLPEDWEIVNEPLGLERDFFAVNIGSSYVGSSFLAARKIAPRKRLMINDFGLFGQAARNNYNKENYFGLLRQLIAEGVPIDIIGIQAHSNGEWFEPADIADTLARYATLNKPLQITEFSTPTHDFDSPETPLRIDGSYRSGIWNEERQAEYYREFYTIAFGEPSVEAIVTWGLDDKRAWLPGIGLVDPDGRRKSNFMVLDGLINGEWRTDFRVRTADGLPVEFRGFFGKYEITVTDRGKVVKKIFELRKNSGNDWLIEL
jgi:endo-1,4-beta-xylanase